MNMRPSIEDVVTIRPAKRLVAPSDERNAPPSGGDVEAAAPRGRGRRKRFTPDPNDPRPIVHVDSTNIEATLKAACNALRDANPDLYLRGRKIVCVSEELKPTASGPKVAAQVICERGENALVYDLSRAAIFLKYDARADGEVPVEPPIGLVRKMRELPNLTLLPVVAGVVNTPTMRADGSVLDTPGYDPATGLVFDPLDVAFPPIPAAPTLEYAVKAKELLVSLISTFPFVEPVDLAVAFSMILTAVARDAIDTAPMHVVAAPVPASGKSKIVDIACVIATGRVAGVINQGATEEELEKRLDRNVRGNADHRDR